MIGLAGHALLDQLPPQSCKWLASIAQRRSYADGEVIHKRGDGNLTMGIVITGEVMLVRLHADGTQTFVASMHRGQHYGDILLLGRPRRTHDAVAVGAVEVDHYDEAAFALVQSNVEVLRALYAVTAIRLAQAMDLNDDLRGLPREVHLAKVLLQLGRKSGDGSTVVCLQEDLAAFLGTSVMTLAKSLAKLKHDGLIQTGYRRIRIIDPLRMRVWLKARSPD